VARPPSTGGGSRRARGARQHPRPRRRSRMPPGSSRCGRTRPGARSRRQGRAPGRPVAGVHQPDVRPDACGCAPESAASSVGMSGCHGLHSSAPALGLRAGPRDNVSRAGRHAPRAPAESRSRRR
jgi:hypothetical protein